jgi:hypothetical protein
MHRLIKLGLFFIIFIIFTYGKNIDDDDDFYDDPNDDPLDIPTSNVTTKSNEISLISINCVESGRCGCYKGNCWSYIDENQTPTTGWWCFTQHEGIRGRQKAWAKCTNSSQCSWIMTCGDCYTWVGQKTGIQTTKILC